MTHQEELAKLANQIEESRTKTNNQLMRLDVVSARLDKMKAELANLNNLLAQQ